MTPTPGGIPTPSAAAVTPVGCPVGWEPPLFIPQGSALDPSIPPIPSIAAYDPGGGGNCCAYALVLDPVTHLLKWEGQISFGGCNSNCNFDPVTGVKVPPDVYAHNFFAGLDPCTGQPSPFPNLNCKVLAWTIAGGNCADSACLPGQVLGPNETCVDQVTPVTCVVPCWLQCAPAVVQAAWCRLLDTNPLECISAALSCLPAFGAAVALDDPFPLIGCLTAIATTCGGAAIAGAAGILLNWLDLGPILCPQCDNVPPPNPTCPPNQYPAPCNRNPGDFLDQRTGCCDPPGEALAALPLLPTPLRLPIPTNSIAVTACASCADADFEEEEINGLSDYA